jgi:dynactin complex subunit
MTLFLAVLISALSVFADEVDVRVFNADAAKSLERYKPVVVSGKEVHSGELGKLPSPVELEKVFTDAKLDSKLNKFDQLDKDIFVLRVKKHSVKELRAFYPAFSDSELGLMKKALEKFGKGAAQ